MTFRDCPWLDSAAGSPGLVVDTQIPASGTPNGDFNSRYRLCHEQHAEEENQALADSGRRHGGSWVDVLELSRSLINLRADGV
ncbi:hypothetical protein R1flu_018835 [Riccia fluitans]|uniref:Uncharacterized protein n=1 Tax=Riccia fluitans TaxID=41844 RepID=A0ABD1ZI07_9MARC